MTDYDYFADQVFPEERLNELVNGDGVVTNIAKEIASVHLLGIEYENIAIFPQDLLAQKCALLRKWKWENGTKATCAALLECLVEAKEYGAAQALVDCLKDQRSDSPHVQESVAQAGSIESSGTREAADFHEDNSLPSGVHEQKTAESVSEDSLTHNTATERLLTQFMKGVPIESLLSGFSLIGDGRRKLSRGVEMLQEEVKLVVEKLLIDRNSLAHDKTRMEKELHSAIQNYEAVLKDRDALKSEVAKTEDFRIQISDLKKIVEALKNELEQALLSKNEALLREKAMLEQALQAKDEAREREVAKTEDFRTQISGLKKIVEAFKREKNELEQVLLSKNEAFQREKVMLEQALQAKDEAREREVAKTEDFRIQISGLEKNVEALEREKNELEQALLRKSEALLREKVILEQALQAKDEAREREMKSEQAREREKTEFIQELQRKDGAHEREKMMIEQALEREKTRLEQAHEREKTRLERALQDEIHKGEKYQFKVEICSLALALVLAICMMSLCSTIHDLIPHLALIHP